MDILTSLQHQLLSEIGASPMQRDFFLGGGTALSACYLHHRFSVDLDLFTDNPSALAQAPATMKEIAERMGLELTFTRLLGTFLECFLRSGSGERVEVDLAQDSPYRLEPVRVDDLTGIHVDNATDIACNKLSALFDRAEPKDFVDIYFIVRELMPFDQLVALARTKHVGIDDYWLAVALRQIGRVEILPRMVKPVTICELREFYHARSEELMDGLRRP